MTYGNHTSKTNVTVHADPRDVTPNRADRRGAELRAELDTTIVQIDRAWTQLQDADKALKRAEGLLDDAPKAVKDSLMADIKDLRKRMAELEEVYTEPEDLKGIQRNPTNLQSKLYTASTYVGQVEGAPSQMAVVSLAQLQEGADEFIDLVAEFMEGEYAAFRREFGAAGLSVFKE